MARSLLTLGFLVDTLLEEYQRRLFAGVCAEAARLNVNVRCLVGGAFAEQGATAVKNRIYRAVSSSHLDGLIVATGSLVNQSGSEGMTRFLRNFAPLPICSLGIELPQVHNVLIDNAAGVREALTHLITEAGCKRVAFIRGPSGNREAEERYRVYREVLSQHRLGSDPDLIANGNFEAASGAAAVATFLDDRHVAFDAVFAASDLMALGALNSLLERGISVPSRVSVVGFDDIDAARFAASPMTTVKQPLATMGKNAVECVLGQLYRGSLEQRVVLPAKLVRRQSSRRGTAAGLQAIEPASYPADEATERAAFAASTQEFDYISALEPDFASQLWNTFSADAAGRRPGLVQRLTFMSYVEHLLLSLAERGGDVTGFQQVLSQLRRHTLPTIDPSSKKRELAENLLHEARMLVGSVAERRQVQFRLQADHFRRATNDIAADLLRAGSFQQLGQIATTRLGQLGISAGALCTYNTESQVNVRVAWDGGFPLDCPLSPFAESELLPGDLLGFERRRNLVVEPLISNDRALGYVVFEVALPEPEAYCTLRDAFTGALRGILGA